MHLDIGLPLLSELEQLGRGFWKNNNHQNHNQDQTVISEEQTQSSEPHRLGSTPKQCSDNGNHTETNHCSQSQDENSAPGSHSDGEQNTYDTFDVRSGSQGTNLSRHRSTSPNLCKNGSESYETGQLKEQFQDKNSIPCHSNRPTLYSAMWDSSAEDSSFL